MKDEKEKWNDRINFRAGLTGRLKEWTTGFPGRLDNSFDWKAGSAGRQETGWFIVWQVIWLDNWMIVGSIERSDSWVWGRVWVTLTASLIGQ